MTTLDTHGSVTAARPCPELAHRRATQVRDVSEEFGWDLEDQPF